MLIALAIFPFAALPVSSIGRRLKQVARRTQIELGGMTSTLTETFAGIRLIKAFRLEGYVVDRLNRHFAAHHPSFHRLPTGSLALHVREVTVLPIDGEAGEHVIKAIV